MEINESSVGYWLGIICDEKKFKFLFNFRAESAVVQPRAVSGMQRSLKAGNASATDQIPRHVSAKRSRESSEQTEKASTSIHCPICLETLEEVRPCYFSQEII